MGTLKETKERLAELFRSGKPCPDCELTGGNEHCPINIALAALKAAGDNWEDALPHVAKLLFLIELQEPEDRAKVLRRLVQEFDLLNELSRVENKS